MDGLDAEVAAGFRQAMRRLTATVSLITTHHQGVRTGMAVTAVQSVAMDPATLLICVNQSASISVPLRERGRFAVNMLHLAHAELVPIFSGKLKGEARFEHGLWTSQEDVPVLVDAQAAIVCDVVGTSGIGSHDVIFGRVRWVRVREEISPLLYENGRVARSEPLPLAG
jgi:flavin reductase